MKKLIFLLISLSFLLSCTTTKLAQCPPENVFYMLENGAPAFLDKGFFDDKNNYMTEEAFKKGYEEFMRKQYGL